MSAVSILKQQLF